MFGLAIMMWPARFGGLHTSVLVHGSSMAPAYSDGDLVFARSKSHYAVGDVIVFRVRSAVSPNRSALVVHRIRSIDAAGKLSTQGDNRATGDHFDTHVNDVVGEVTIGVPRVGHAFSLLCQPWLLAVVVGLFCARGAAAKHVAGLGVAAST